MKKIFIIGLPRTGTTSVCAACMELGFKTAHTAYTQKTFKQAQVIADTPIFNDYQRLASIYPDAKFIYLDRVMSQWLPSISQLLARMSANLFTDKGGFNDTIKRCYLNTFLNLNSDRVNDYQYLESCYNKHKSTALNFFLEQGLEHLVLNLDDQMALKKLARFLDVEHAGEIAMPCLNKKGKVTAWNDIRHSLKVSSTRNGKVDKDELLLHGL